MDNEKKTAVENTEYLSGEEYERLAQKEAKRRKTIHRLLYILFVLAVSVLLAMYISPRLLVKTNEGLLVQSEISAPDLSEKSDGVYKGTYTTAGFSCTAEVTVITGTIAKVEITDSAGIDRPRAEAVASAIAAFNSFDLSALTYNDTQLGSEPTDIVVFMAVYNALTEGISV